ncbi:MAG: PKD domain-containing protein [Bacteroidetes bacterium]|nr:PKD domain-containing protein [Bacteroidota bacterium]
MNKFLLPFAFLLFAGIFLNNSFAQKSKKPDYNWSDPSENFYVTQARMNAYYKKFEKELANEKKGSSVTKATARKVGAEEEKELAGYELYKRWEYMVAPRVYPSGDKTLFSKAFEEYQAYKIQNSQQKLIGTGASVLSNTWQPIGPFGDLTGANVGRINALRFDPASATGYWACAPAGGLWKTGNNGSSWSTNTDQLTITGCSDVVFDPTNSQNMFLATGDGEAGDNYSIGVLKSTNGGVTWGSTGLSYAVINGVKIYKLLINPLNKNTIFAATSAGLQRTSNGGTTWNPVITTGVITDIEYKPNDTTTVYAVSKSFYLSTNGGTSFSAITAGLPTSSANNRLAIAVTPANPAFVYVVASAASNSGFLGFYQSTNSGTSFTNKATTPNLLGWASAGNDAGGQGWYTLSIAASPTNANEVVVGGVNIWRTLNAGTSWNIFAHWTGTGAPYVHADVHDLIYKSGTTLFVGCDGGVFVTSNSGSSFSAMNGNMNISQIYKIGLSASTYSRAITGHQDNGTNIYSGGWSGTMGGDGMNCFIDQTNDNVMYGEQYNGSFNRTTNGGGSWTAITTGMTGNGAWVTPWHQDPIVANANTIYGGRQQMFKSTNQGTNWAQIGTMGGTGSIVEFAVAPSNNQVIYVIKGNALYKTIDGGTTWTAVTGTLPVGSAQLSWITVKDTDPNSVWVTFSGYSAPDKVFQSTDGAATWTNYSTGLPNLPANCITYWNGTNNGLYIGCDVGVYYRDAGMTSWGLYNAGLPNVIVQDISIFYPLGKLRIATYGRGVWEADLYNSGTMAPIANFMADKTFICPAMTINFTDQSTFVPTTWNWIFQGGAPATSTVQNPSIVYNTPGTYSVSLTAANANGSSVLTKTLYITVSPTNVLPLVEGFQGTGFPPADWQNFDAGSDNLMWNKSTTVGKASTASIRYDNYNLNSVNIRDEMRTPKYNFSGLSSAKLYFDVAYARYDAIYSDTLAVRVTTNCGLSYTQVYIKGGPTLATAPDFSTAIFVPTAAQWRTDTVSLSAFAGQSNVMVSFQNHGQYGQALYIDNVNISGVSVSAVPTASFSAFAPNYCVGQAIALTDQSTNSPTSWNWQMPGAGTTTSSASNPTVTYAASGVYTVTLIASNSIGSSSPVTQTIQVNALPTVAVSSTANAICLGQNITLSASGASTYSWNTGATTSNLVVSPTSNTSYTVTGTNASGCKNTAVKSITVNALPTVNITGGGSSVCSGSSVNLTAGGANTYTWSTSATTASVAVTVTANTTYSVTGTNANGCSNTAATTVSVNPTPAITAPNGAICPGSTFTITPSGAVSYSYSSGSQFVSPSTTTSYTVTGSSAQGCSAVPAVITVSVTSFLAVSITGANAVCSGSSVILTANGASTYTWNNGALTNTISVSPSSATTYSVLGSGGSGCTGTNTYTVAVNALPVISISPSSNNVCSGQSVSLTGSGASTYTWNTGATTNAIAVSPTANTSYSLSGTNGSGCTGSSTVSITVNSAPNISASSNTPLLCTGQSASISATGAVTYTWSNGMNGTPIVVSPTVNTTYTVNGTDANGCQNSSVITQFVSICTGINNLSNNTSVFVVYPNPNKGDFTIELSETSEIIIYNLLAEIIVDKVMTQGKHSINLDNKAAGVYFVKSMSGNKRQVVKLIVQ